MENSNQKLLIIGAGLCGSLLALRMAQRGYQVQLVEKRPDLRDVTQDAGRSINLSLSDRGLKALRLATITEIIGSPPIQYNKNLYNLITA